MQFFQRKENVILSGINEVLELLKNELNSGIIKVKYLREGTRISPLEVVLELQSEYKYIAIYEGIIDGILSRSSSLSTNAFECVQAAGQKEIICMADRSDHYRNLKSDVWSYYIGGIRSFSSPILKENRYFKNLKNREKIKVYRSIPHGVIQIFKGDTVSAMKAYSELFSSVEMVALVDFNNDVLGDSIKLFKTFGDRLKGVRVDSSPDIVDKSLSKLGTSREVNGVNILLVDKLRKALDEAGGHKVKIYISSGLNPQKIESFEAFSSSVEGYGVGEYLSKIRVHFTGDLVRIGTLNLSKAGRRYRPNSRLITYNQNEDKHPIH